MAYNPYSLTRVARPATPAPGSGRYALSRQPALTDNGQEEERQNLQGLRTGQFADVQSAAVATQRANAMRTSQGLQAARGTIARSGDVSPEAALRAQDQALAAASAQNLNADNQVNQMQRQYRQDALNRASAIEDRTYGRAANERAYQTDADRYSDDQAWRGYAADVDEESRLFGQNFQLGERDRTQRNTDREFNEGVRRYDLGRADYMGDKAEARRQFDLNYNAGRSDRAEDVSYRQSQAADDRNRFDLGRADQNSQFDRTFAANRADRADDRNRFDLSRADQNSQFDRTFGANRQDRSEDVAYRNNQAAEDARRYDLSRGDQNSQFDRTFGASREDRANDVAFRDRQYGDLRGDVAYNRAEDRSRYDDSRADLQSDREYRAYRDSIGDERYNQQYTDQRSDTYYARGYQERRDAIGDQRYADETEYSRGRDQLADDRYNRQYMDSRDDVMYGRTRDALGDQRYDEATAYSRSRDALGDSRYADETAYSRGRDTLGDQRYAQDYADRRGDVQYLRDRDSLADSRYASETAYARSRDAIADGRYNMQYAEQQGNLAKSDQLAAINSIADPKARQAAYNAYMRGEDVRQFITGTLFDDKGTLNQDYRSASPGEAAAQARADELKQYYPKEYGESDAAYEQRIGQMARAQGQAEYETSTGPVRDAALERSLNTKLASGAALTPDEKAYGVKAGLVNTFTAKTLPKNQNINELVGQQVNVDGKVYTVVGGDSFISERHNMPGVSNRHTDYAILEQGGRRVYVTGDGKVLDQEPQDVR